ncbi:MAG: hypothetical protein JNG82_13770 [Opitutaceae bacterium]|nr:hypothetical protein [Opitutaceae bacterium]
MRSLSPCRSIFSLSLAGFLLGTAGFAAGSAGEDFGKDVQLAPFVVKGQRLSISIHARTKGDRKYAEAFAEDAVGIAYETMGKSTGAGLVIVGREGEPHPVVVIRKFLAMSAAGQLDPAVAAKTRELVELMDRWKATLNIDQDAEDDEKDFKITFDMIMPALPLPLEGLASKLYQLSWAEGFAEAKVDQKLRALTLAELESDALAKYDWAFYLPPRNAYVGVQNAVMQEVMQKEKMGLFKRAAIKSALVVFKPAVKKAVEGFRKGMLFLTVLRARSGWSKDDIKFLTGAYMEVLMPDFKFNGGTERARALAAIEQQKVKNAEYAKDPYISPARLATFDPAAYAPFEGDYGKLPVDKQGKLVKDGKPPRALVRQDDAWLWRYRRGKPTVLHPAGERLFVSADGKLSVQFKIDEQGAITGAEERRERHRQTYYKPGFEPKPAVAATPAPTK